MSMNIKAMIRIPLTILTISVYSTGCYKRNESDSRFILKRKEYVIVWYPLLFYRNVLRLYAKRTYIYTCV